VSAIPKGLDRLKINVIVRSIWKTVLIPEDFRGMLWNEFRQVLHRKFDCDQVETILSREILRELHISDNL
jgi:hypothetical protein